MSARKKSLVGHPSGGPTVPVTGILRLLNAAHQQVGISGPFLTTGPVLALLWDMPPVSAGDGYQTTGARHRQRTVSPCEACATEPARMSPAARTPGTLVFSEHGRDPTAGSDYSVRVARRGNRGQFTGRRAFESAIQLPPSVGEDERNSPLGTGKSRNRALERHNTHVRIIGGRNTAGYVVPTNSACGPEAPR
jgi:hypothetical protein